MHQNKICTSSLSEDTLDLLQKHPRGISEYDLLRELQSRGREEFADLDFNDHLSLYRKHFLLFNTLYRLRDTLATQGRGLNISPLNIRLYDLDTSDTAMGMSDRLRDYYLNAEEMRNTSEADIEEMLGRFWSRLTRGEDRKKALRTLGLMDPVSDEEIKQRYRSLAMRHHPDRGGDTAKLQDINAAMKALATG